MFKKIFSNELARGSFILFIMINVANAINYLFHFLTARLLGPSDYSVLAVLMSIVYIFTVPGEALQTLMSRYTSKFNIKKEFGKMNSVLGKIIHKGLSIAFFSFIIFALLSFILSYYLKVDYFLLFITGGILFGIFLVPVVRGVMQGRKKFTSLGFNLIIESICKIFIAFLLISLGLRVYGAITGVLFGILIAFFLSYISIKEVYNAKKIDAVHKGIYEESLSIFLVMLSIIIVYSIDIIFAKLFFSPDIAGKYAVASMIGKMIFFGTAPISKAMLPISSEVSETGDKTRSLFIKSFWYIIGICIIPLLIMVFYPELLISLLFGSAYLEVSGLLVYFGIIFLLLSLTNLVIIYGISVKRLRKPYLLFSFVMLEIVLFFLFHANIKQFTLAFLALSITIFISSFLFIRRKK